MKIAEDVAEIAHNPFEEEESGLWLDPFDHGFGMDG